MSSLTFNSILVPINSLNERHYQFCAARQSHLTALAPDVCHRPIAALLSQVPDLEMTVQGYTLAVWPHGTAGLVGLMGIIWLVA